MLSMKKTTVVILSIMSNAVFSGSMGATCIADGVSLACERKGWDFGVEALYLRPSYSGAMGWIGVNTSTDGSYTKVVENTPRWTWGFKLEGAYYFNTGNDFNVNWYHLGNNRARMHSRENAFTSTISNDEQISYSLTTIKPSWDAINLEVGQQLNFGAMKNIRIHGGLQVAHISNNNNVSGPLLISQELFAYNAETNSKFTGVGPRIGTDLSYGLLQGFNIYGKGAIALLVGTSELNRAYTNTTTDASSNNTLTTIKATVISPEFETKLGLNYTYSLTRGALTLDAGYLWVNYFNATFHQKFFRPQDINFNVSGPYAGFKWVGTAV